MKASHMEELTNLINNRLIILKAKLNEPASMHSTGTRAEWKAEAHTLQDMADTQGIKIWDMAKI